MARMMSYFTTSILAFCFMAATLPRVSAEEDIPVAVPCIQDTYALCAYANCTINADLKTANCPCFSLSGPSMARIDVIPDATIQQATIDACTANATACAQADQSPICDAIADKTLWKGADAVSTFSMALQVENGVAVDENGTRLVEEPTWSCTGIEGRLVPNCMLAPCRALETAVTNPYFAGEATLECTCPLLDANVDYGNFGGLQSPCEDSPVPMEGGYVQNAGGPVLAQHAADPSGVSDAWDAVRMEFNGASADKTDGSDSGSPSCRHMGISVGMLGLVLSGVAFLLL